MSAWPLVPPGGSGIPTPKWEDQFVRVEGLSVEPVIRIREAVHQRLGEVGWSILDNHPLSLPHRRVSAIPLRDGWFATLLVDDRLEDDEHENPILLAEGILGLDYEPARRITMALTGAPRSGVVFKNPSLPIALTGALRPDGPVAQLVGFATGHLDYLSKLADVDTVIAMLHERRAAPATEISPFLDDEHLDPPAGYARLPDPVTQLVPVFFAAAARYQEARSALAQCEDSSWQELANSNDRRLLRQLKRWVDHEGELALPSTPARWAADWPPATPGPDSSRGFMAFMAEQRPEIVARQEAVKATRAASEGKNREQIRELLRAELDTRGVKMQPVDFEQNLDFLATEHEPFGHARLALRGFKALKDLISTGPGLLATLREDDQPPAEADPMWAETPDRAGYPMWPVTRERAGVELDREADPLLTELMLGSRGQFGNRNVEIWLSREDPELIVHIGSRRVGRLDASHVDAFAGAIHAAADRDEDVRTDARLTRMSGTPAYVLDLPLHDAGASQV